MTNWTNRPIFWMNQRAGIGLLPVLACEPQQRGGLDCVRCSKTVRLQRQLCCMFCQIQLCKFLEDELKHGPVCDKLGAVDYRQC